jgi:hypothetical protein
MEIKLLTHDNCEELLQYRSKQTLREAYNLDRFPDKYLKRLDSATGYEINDTLTLDPTTKGDAQSSIELHKALPNLNRAQANDRRLWCALTHGLYFKYTKERWGINDDSSDKQIEERFHYVGGGLVTRQNNALARLWWAACQTYDNKIDSYELTEVLFSSQDLYQRVSESRFFTYSGVVCGLLTFFKENPQLRDKEEKRPLISGLNAIGGVKVLSMMTKDHTIAALHRLAKHRDIKIN